MVRKREGRQLCDTHNKKKKKGPGGKAPSAPQERIVNSKLKRRELVLPGIASGEEERENNLLGFKR